MRRTAGARRAVAAHSHRSAHPRHPSRAERSHTMTTYVSDDNGGTLCVDCAGRCSRALPVRCDDPWCECACNHDGRARDLDDRPASTLAAIAAEIERENRPTVEQLMAERYGVRRRSA